MTPHQITNNFSNSNLLIKKCLWLYFWLLIFEGVLRKWIFPQLSTPLLVIRDPVSLIIIFQSLNSRIIRFNYYLFFLITATIISIFTGVLFGHGNLFVAIYGARIYLLHFPLIFIMGAVFEKNDIINFGKKIVFLVIPCTILISIQYFSPHTSFINSAAGGEVDNSALAAGLGHYRPSGLFTFTTSNVLYYSLALCFSIYFWLSEQKYINNIILILSLIALLISIPINGSRTYLFQLVITIAFVIIISVKNPKILIKILPLLIVFTLIVISLATLSYFNESTEAFKDRFSSANDSEGGIQGVFLDRFLGGLISAVSESNKYPYFGVGLGLGTNVGSQLVNGSTGFAVAEVEWGRIVGESGLLIGLVIIFSRLLFSIQILVSAFKKIKEYNNILPWILMSFGFLTLSQGQFAAPTNLGFAVLIGGFTLASLKNI